MIGYGRCNCNIIEEASFKRDQDFIDSMTLNSYRGWIRRVPVHRMLHAADASAIMRRCPLSIDIISQQSILMKFQQARMFQRGELARIGLSVCCSLICCSTSNVCAQEESVTSDQLSTTTPLSRMDEAWWKERHDLRLADRASNEPLDLLLVGDSITQGCETTGKVVWEKTFGDLRSMNLGFSGDRTEHVLWRLQNGEVDGINPAVVMVLIGTNNTGHNLDKPKDIAEGVKAIVEELKSRLPNSRILLLAVFPYDKDPRSPRRKNNNAVNEIIQKFDDGQKVYYLDICKKFFDESGNMTKEVTPDFLHLSEKGYQVWADGVNEELRKLVKSDE